MPTLAEAAYPEIKLSTWYGMWAPAGTSPNIVQQINAAVVKILREPDVRARLDAVQLEAVGDWSAQFASFCQSEAQRYASIVKLAGIKAE